MIAILKNGTTVQQRDHLISWLKNMNLDVHLSEGAEVTILGLVGDTSRVDMELLSSLAERVFMRISSSCVRMEKLAKRNISGSSSRETLQICAWHTDAVVAEHGIM